MSLTILSCRDVFLVNGPEAENFLQGLISNDLGLLDQSNADQSNAIHAALLSPQGKLLYAFFVSRNADNGFYIDCSRLHKPELIKRLQFYRLRAKVNIAEPDPALSVVVLWGKTPDHLPAHLPAHLSVEKTYPDPRLPEMGTRALINSKQINQLTEQTSEDDYHRHRIALGVPDGSVDIATQKLFPHEANFDQLNGISFQKGCFIGQEVIARTEHRGLTRKRIVPVTTKGAVPVPGSDITLDGRVIGTLLSHSGNQALALIHLEKTGEALAQDRPVMAGEARLTPRLPGWAKFDFTPNKKHS